MPDVEDIGNENLVERHLNGRVRNKLDIVHESTYVPYSVKYM